MSGVHRRPDSTHLDGTDRRALTEWLTVLSDYGRARDAPDCYVVVSASGAEYFVDRRAGACECPDAAYRHRQCKHVKRVRYATGELVIPGWVALDRIHPSLGAHVAGRPRVATPDGPRPLAEVRD